MSEYIIASASTADLPREFFEQHNVPFISYAYIIDGNLYQDDSREESRREIYKKMREGVNLTTSMINVYEYLDFFRPLMEQGKDVIFLDMSKEMSRSYANAKETAEMIAEEFPNQRLYMMDTLCISGGLGLLVESMVQKKEEGMSFDELVAWGEENKLKIMHRFTVDDLNYLKRGGRVSNSAALVGSLLNVKPVLYVPDEGTLNVAKKARGRKAALNEIIDGVKRDMVNPETQTVHILNADCLADAEYVKAGIIEAFPNVKEIVITSLGVVIGAHCGPGLLTVFYFGDKRKP